MARPNLKATKSPSEKEEDEISRMIRPMPKKKPPRQDKVRDRIHVEDSDTDEEDKDLSLNYKDIGGSLESVVARSFLKEAIDFPTEEAFSAYMDLHPDADPKNHTLKGKKPGAPKHPDDIPDPVEEEETSKEPEPKEPEPKNKAPKLEDLDSQDLYEQATQGTGEDAAKARKILEKRKSPFPEGVTTVTDFNDKLTEEDVVRLKGQLKHWDMMDFSQNLKEIAEHRVEAELSGNEKDQKYYDAVMSVYQESKQELRVQSLSEVQDVVNLFGGSPTEKFSDSDKPVLAQKRRDWWQSSMFSSHSVVSETLEKVKSVSSKLDPNSQRGVYAKELTAILEEVQGKKALSPDVAVDRLLLSLQGLENDKIPDPATVDFTDTEAVSEYIDKLRTMDNASLAQMVADEPMYRMLLGMTSDDDPSKMRFSEKQRSAFFDSFKDDINARGFYEQLRFHDEESNSVFDIPSLLAYREKLTMELARDKTKIYTPPSFWDTFLLWMDEASSKALNKESSMTGRAIKAGIMTAFLKEGLRLPTTAQYRGLPGELSPEDPYAPIRTQWRLPSSSQSLHKEDYLVILKEAREWLRDPFLRIDREFDFETACRTALDYSIHSASNFKYNGSVSAPLHASLLQILQQLELDK